MIVIAQAAIEDPYEEAFLEEEAPAAESLGTVSRARRHIRKPRAGDPT